MPPALGRTEYNGEGRIAQVDDVSREMNELVRQNNVGGTLRGTRLLVPGLLCALSTLALLTPSGAARAQEVEEESAEPTEPTEVVDEGPRRTGKCSAPFKFDRKHPALQRALLRRLSAKGFDRYLKRKQLAISVADLTRKGRVYYAGVNDNHMMYAASMPKIGILLAVVDAVNEGKLEWTHEFDKRLQNMIVASSNSDASWGANLVGLDGLESVMRDPRYCLYKEPVGGLWVGRGYGGMSGENRDPLFNLSHGATTRQVARFYTMLDAGKLVSPHWSFRMLGLMSPPKHHHKFVGGLQTRKEVVFLARKSGTWRHFHADSALVQHQGRVYAVTAIAEHTKGGQWMMDVIKIVDDIVMEGKHRKKRRRRRIGRR